MLLSCALVVVSARNTIHCVLFLILAFLNAAALFIMLGAEFLAMILIIVYVGAIAVLFLFVVMMLNIDQQNQQNKAKFKQDLIKHLPLILIVGGIFFFEIFTIIKYSSAANDNLMIKFLPIDSQTSNINAIGQVLYTDFFYPFQMAGAILFVAMIGAIVLTIRQEHRFIRKQKIAVQIARDKSHSIEIVKVKSGEGIDI